MASSKYRTLLDSLSNEILGGKYGSSQAFPSINALAKRFGEPRSTVYRAIAELAHQGLVSQKQGRGTVVTKVGMSRKIGLIVPDIAQTEFFSQIVHEVSCLAQRKGYALLFGEIVSEDVQERARVAERLAKDFVGQGVSGVVFQPIEFLRGSETVNRRIISIFDAARIPVVLCDYDFVAPSERGNYDVVGINNLKAGYAMFRYLRSMGAKDIRFLMRPYASQSHQDRFRGAVIASLEGGCGNANVCKSIIARPDDLASLRRHLKRHRPDAVICCNDKTAAIFKRTLDCLGIRVPEDILLAGFDDVSVASIMSPSLTTIHQPCDLIAKAAFDRLLARIAEPDLPPTEILLSSTLVARESTADMKARISRKPKRKEKRNEG